jgi:hypothetical protein
VVVHNFALFALEASKQPLYQMEIRNSKPEIRKKPDTKSQPDRSFQVFAVPKGDSVFRI